MTIFWDDIKDKKVREIEELYRLDLRLNRNRLEVASEEQNTKFESWYSCQEDASADLEDAKHNLSLLRARVDIKIRRAPKEKLIEKYGIADLKEGAIKAFIELNPKVVEAQEKVNRLKLVVGKLKGAIESARQRKSMIAVLKDLYVSNFWDKVTKRGTPHKSRDRLTRRD